MTEAEQIKPIVKPRVGVYGFTGCAGDQLVIIHTEDEILNLFGAANIKSFVMASSKPDESELDVALVEGSVSTEEQKEHLLDIRKRAKIVVAIGNCAVNGGPQAMFVGDGKYDERMNKVYGEMKFFIPPMEAKPIDAFVTVDYYLPGCPIDSDGVFALLARLIHGAAPEPFPHPVCHECKLNDNMCRLLNKEFCLGPLTVGGCGSICINHGVPCVGCWGVNTDGNFKSHLDLLGSIYFDPLKK